MFDFNSYANTVFLPGPIPDNCDSSSIRFLVHGTGLIEYQGCWIDVSLQFGYNLDEPTFDNFSDITETFEWIDLRVFVIFDHSPVAGINGFIGMIDSQITELN